MDHLAAYLFSILLFSGLYIVFVVSEGEFEIKNGEEVLKSFGGAVVWPLTLLFLLGRALYNAYKKSYTNEAERMMRKHHINDVDKHDRSFIVQVPERAMKHILRAYRKKFIELNDQQVEIIRDELMHRMTERTLLK